MLPPIILTGRGQSGTRLLSQFAQHSGVFLGKMLKWTDDSRAWIPLIYRLAKETAKQELPSGNAHRDEIHAEAQKFLAGVSPDTPWGWKLPETMLVLPLFVDAFPEAKVVHMVRHPVGILRHGEHVTTMADHQVGRAVLKAAYAYCGRDVSLFETDERHFRHACSWRYQVERIMAYGRTLDSSRYLEVCFEDLCRDPDGGGQRIASFIGVPYKKWEPEIDPHRIKTRVEPDHPMAKVVWDICGKTATELGYTQEAE